MTNLQDQKLVLLLQVLHSEAVLEKYYLHQGCQSTLLRILEDCKKNMDSDKYLAAILMDLSKAITVSSVLSDFESVLSSV
jgi:hypothetical protein